MSTNNTRFRLIKFGSENVFFFVLSQINVPGILPISIVHPLRMASKSKAAVISITETWLDSSITDGEIHIDDFLVLHRDRNRNSGGICVYIRIDFAFTSRSDIQTDSDEIIFVELLLPKTKPITVGTV